MSSVIYITIQYLYLRGTDKYKKYYSEFNVLRVRNTKGFIHTKIEYNEILEDSEKVEDNELLYTTKDTISEVSDLSSNISNVSLLPSDNFDFSKENEINYNKIENDYSTVNNIIENNESDISQNDNLNEVSLNEF